MPQIFGVVPQKVLNSRGNALRLHALDVADRDGRREEWVFSKILEVTAIPRRAVDVHSGAQHKMNAAGPRVPADSRTDLFGKSGIPRRRKADADRIGGGRKPFIAAHTNGAVRHLKRRQAESGDGPNSKASSADVIDLFLERHFAEVGVRPLCHIRIGRCGRLGKGRRANEQEYRQNQRSTHIRYPFRSLFSYWSEVDPLQVKLYY